jgi:hypothetical protein
VRLGLALSEKQTPQVVGNIGKPNELMEGLELSIVLRRQMLYPTELRAHPLLFFDSIAFVLPIRVPHGCNFLEHLKQFPR